MCHQKAKARKERVDKLVENLINKISIFTESAQGAEDKMVIKAFKEKCRLEAECVIGCLLLRLTHLRELREESYGVELLHAIGKTYQAKAEHYKVIRGKDTADNRHLHLSRPWAGSTVPRRATIL